MEKARRESLRAVVTRARGRIERSLAGQLAGFGFFRDTEPATKADLRLGPTQEALYPRLLDVVLREGRAVGKEGKLSPEGVARFVRESGATWVNRLAALRALEVRGLLNPAAAFVSDEYGGASPRGIRLREASADSRMSRDESIRAGIQEACLELSASVRVLFDLADEHSLLWPDLTELREVLRDFSSDVTTADWAEPDVLGWVYQYYNTDANAELKKRKNKTTGFKYKPDDIPIANQFYTPHWVVRVLTDNTLGRLWLEAHDRLPRLDTEPYRLADARAGVPHPADEPEAFKRWTLEEPDPLTDETVDRLCRFLVPLPSRAVPRARKSVREIRVLDPACGSGHFLLYAFDLLFAMYREAEPELDPRDIPALILANNLFGVDIDLRAAQLAAFSLYLKARTTLARVDPNARLTVLALNIVVADAHIGNDPRKAAFLERYKDDPEIRQLYAKVLLDLDHTNVLGSLLKVRTEFESLFGRVREGKAKSNEWEHADQQTLLDVSRQPELAESFRSFSGRTWTIGELIADLRHFEEEVMPAQDIGARLFYTDLQRSVGVLAILSAQYDVVLMNPPYADMPPEARDYLAGNKKKKIPGHYIRTSQSLDAAFLEQGVDLLAPGGFMGALVPRAFMFYSSHEAMRREILAEQAHLAFLHDYGLGILDGATVRTAGLVVGKSPSAHDTSGRSITFQRLSYYQTEAKVERFVLTLLAYARSGPIEGTDFFIARLASLDKVPGMPYSYWASESLRDLFQQYPVLDYCKVLSPRGLRASSVGRVLQGIATQDDTRFTRFWWELTRAGEKLPDGWRTYAKGGSNVLFYTRLDLAVDWRDDGAGIKTWIRDGLGDHPTRHLRNLAFQGLEGLTWRAVAWTTRRFGHVSPDSMFSNRGSMVFTEASDLRAILGFLNSSLAAALLLCQTNEREWHISEVAALPISPRLKGEAITAVEGLIQGFRKRHEADETCRDFGEPELRRAWDIASRRLDVKSLLKQTMQLQDESERDIDTKLSNLDNEVLAIYRICEEDRLLIERETNNRPKSESGYSTLELDVEGDGPDESDEAQAVDEVQVAQRARDFVSRWVSSYVKQVLESDDDGIVPVWPTRTEPGLIVRLGDTMERDLGRDSADALMAQAPRHLGTHSLNEWLAVSREESVAIDHKTEKRPVGFFLWHIDLYRKRPIFWLLSSEGFEHGKVRFRLQIYLHYLKLTPDTLPRLVSHYVEPVIEDYIHKEWTDAQARAGRLEGKPLAAAKAEAQEWLNTLDALKGFRAAIEAVIQGPSHAERVPANAKWLTRTIAAVRGGQDLGHGYKPHLDYGVRVNITPLVEKKLLPRLASKRLGG